MDDSKHKRGSSGEIPFRQWRSINKCLHGEDSMCSSVSIAFPPQHYIPIVDSCQNTMIWISVISNRGRDAQK